MNSKIIGLILIFGTIFIVTLIMGISVYIDILGLLFVFIITFGLMLVSVGKDKTFKSFNIFFWLFKENIITQSDMKDILLKLIRSLYISASLGTFIGLISLFSNYNKIVDPYYNIAVALISLFYSFVIAELIVRPIIYRIKEND